MFGILFMQTLFCKGGKGTNQHFVRSCQEVQKYYYVSK